MTTLKKPTFIDLFAGCGGLSLGLMSSGWRGLFAVEKDPLAFSTLRRNLIDREEGPRSLRYEWPDWLPRQPIGIGQFISRFREQLTTLRGHVDLIAAGPPCQGFSFAGRRRRADRRNGLAERFCVEIVGILRPTFVLLENVSGMAVEFDKKQRSRSFARKGRVPKSFAQRIADRIGSQGYDVYCGTAKAVDFGVAQYRPRHIMIAVRRGSVPKGNRSDPFDLLLETRPSFLRRKGLSIHHPVTAQEAISDLEIRERRPVECVDSPGFWQIPYAGPRTKYQRLLHGTLNGISPNSLRLARHRPQTIDRFARMLAGRRGVTLSPTEKHHFGTTKWKIAVLDPARPAHTLTTLPDDLLHYSEPRILTVRECARLQSFPDWFEFLGKYTTGGRVRRHQAPRYTQVGNAVPPFLGEALGVTLATLHHRVLRLAGANRFRA